MLYVTSKPRLFDTESFVMLQLGGGSPQFYYHDCSGRIPGHTTSMPPVGPGRVRTGNQRLPVLCHCQLGQDIPVFISYNKKVGDTAHLNPSQVPALGRVRIECSAVYTLRCLFVRMSVELQAKGRETQQGLSDARTRLRWWSMTVG